MSTLTESRRPLPLVWIGAALLLVGVVGVAWRYFNPGAQETETQTKPLSGEEVEEQTDDMVLSKKGRQFLWDVEHVAFEMETGNLRQLQRALGEGKWELLADHLHAGFTAEVPTAAWSDAIESSLVDIRRKTLAEGGRQLDANGFIEHLKSIRAEFEDEGCRAKIGLVRLGPKDGRTFTGDWVGRWRTRWWGVRDGHPLEYSLMLDVELAPLTADVAEQRNIIRSAKLSSITRRSTELELLRDVTKESGINTAAMFDYWVKKSAELTGSSGGVYLCDYDDDGVVDALIDDPNRGPVLYRGLGDMKFEEATETAGLPTDLGFRGAPTWADLDGDGDEDLICCKRIFSNNGDGSFEDVTHLSNLSGDMFDKEGRRIHRGNGELCIMDHNSLAVADYDGDGLVDIYEVHGHSPNYKQRSEDPSQRNENPRWLDGGLGHLNVLWRNKGDWQFEDVTDAAGAAGNGGVAFTAIWLHANDDVAPDLLSINELGVNSLLINQGDGTFANTKIDPVFGGWSMGAAAGDYDNDGDTDIYVANMYSKAGNRVISNVSADDYPKDVYEKIYNGTRGNKLYINQGDGTFQPAKHDPVIAERGWTYGPDFVDLNGDGLLDLYTTAGFKSERRGDPDG